MSCAVATLRTRPRLGFAGVGWIGLKRLARSALETAQTIATAHTHDKLLEVDFCYRMVAGVPQLLQLARSGAIGEIFAADLVFHNACGPDKPWFYDLGQSGGAV